MAKKTVNNPGTQIRVVQKYTFLSNWNNGMNWNFEADKPKLNGWNVLFCLLFYNALDLNNQKNLWLPSILHSHKFFSLRGQYIIWTILTQIQEIVLHLWWMQTLFLKKANQEVNFLVFIVSIKDIPFWSYYCVWHQRIILLAKSSSINFWSKSFSS